MYHEFWFIQKKQLLLPLAQGTRGGEEHRVGMNAGWVGTRGGEEHGVGRNAGGD